MDGRRKWTTGLGNLAAVLLVYFLVPVSTDESKARLAFQLVAAVAAVGLAGFVVLREVTRRHQGAPWGLTGVRLVLVLEFVVVVFSFAYYLLALQGEGQMDGIETRLDALYFTVVTMATVGYGDVHATGQVARGVVTLHILFNLAFLTVLANLMREWVARDRTDESEAPS
jgi:voltage-gated potassium channel